MSGRVYPVNASAGNIQSFSPGPLSGWTELRGGRPAFHPQAPRFIGLLFARYGMREAGMRLVILLLALLGGLVLVGMLVAPYQPGLRGWYLQNACPYLDQLSQDICAAARREAREGGTQPSTSGEPPR